MALKCRRVVTGLASDGRSTIILDGEAPNSVDVSVWPGLSVATLWNTTGIPGGDKGNADRSLVPVGHGPLPGGTILRLYQFPPDAARPPDCGKLLGLEGATELDWATIHPMMHATQSIDYLVILSGEMTMIMEDRTEVVLFPGDCVVQRGTKHAWSNRGNAPVVLLVVLVDAHGLAG